MGYRKYREERAHKTGCAVEAKVIEKREVEKNEITTRLAAGESPFVLGRIFGYNAVVKACHTPKRRKLKRSEFGEAR